MSSLVSFTFLRIFPKFHLASLNIVRHKRSPRQHGFVRNTLDPDKDFYLDDELEEEPVAYIDDSPDAALRPTKLTRGMERELQNEALRKNIQKRREYKSMNPKEPSLLTWAARNQIKHLHKMDPQQWDPDTLTRSFPVTKFVIKEILRSKLVPYDMAEIHKHDRLVYRNWLKLKKQAEAYQEGNPVDPGYRVLLEDERRRSMLVNAAGIADLPIPQEQSMMLTQQDMAEQARPHVTPQFSSILGGQQGDHKGSLKPMNPLSVPLSTMESGTDKGFIGFSDPEIMNVLEGLSKLKVNKENQMLSIKGGILEDSDSVVIRQEFSPKEVAHEDEFAMGNAHWLKNSHEKSETNEELKEKTRHWSRNQQIDSKPRTYYEKENERNQSQFDDGNMNSYTEEYITPKNQQKPQRREINDGQRQSNKYGNMKDQGQNGENYRKDYRQDRSRQHHRSDTMNDHGQFYEKDRNSYRQDRPRHHHKSDRMNDHGQFYEGDRNDYRQDGPRQHHRSDRMNDHRPFNEGDRNDYRQDRPRQHHKSDRMNDHGQFNEGDRNDYRQDRQSQHHKSDRMNDHGQFNEGDRNDYRQDRPRQHQKSDTKNDHRQFNEGDRNDYRQDRPRQHQKSDTKNDHRQFNEGDRNDYRQDRSRQHHKSDTLNDHRQFNEGDGNSYRQDRSRQHHRSDTMNDHGQFNEGDRNSYRQDMPRQHHKYDTMNDHRQFNEGDRNDYRQDRPRQHHKYDRMNDHRQFNEGDRNEFRQENRTHKVYQKPQKGEPTDNAKQHYKSDTMKDQGPFSYREEQRHPRYPEKRAFSKRQGGRGEDGSHYGFQEKRHRNYGQYSAARGDDFDRPRKLSGSLDDIYMLIKPDINRGRKQ